jgi:hypothetical protein
MIFGGQTIGSLPDTSGIPPQNRFRFSAVEGGLLLSKATRSSRPLEIAIDMAIDHVARQTTRSQFQTDTE